MLNCLSYKYNLFSLIERDPNLRIRVIGLDPSARCSTSSLLIVKNGARNHNIFHLIVLHREYCFIQIKYKIHLTKITTKNSDCSFESQEVKAEFQLYIFSSNKKFNI